MQTQTLTLKITHTHARKALRALEEKHFIKIIDEPSFDSPALRGKVLHLQEFKNWIASAETSPTVSLNTRKIFMAKQKKAITTTRQIRVSVNALKNINEITGYIAFVNQEPLNAIKAGDAFLDSLTGLNKIHLLLKNVLNFQPKQKYIGRQSVIPGLLSIKSQLPDLSSWALFTDQEYAPLKR